LPVAGHFLILVHVTSYLANNRVQSIAPNGRIPEFAFLRYLQAGLLTMLVVLMPTGLLAASSVDEQQRENFSRAWNAATRGERAIFDQLMPGLTDYLLYPYLQYEDLRFRRSSVNEAEMSAFLDAHEDWAFTAGLETAWLRTLGKQKQWDSLLRHAPGSTDTEVQCYLAHARIQRGQTEGLIPEAQTLWAVGKSQPDACDPVFSWLQKQGGITSGLAWQRIRAAMEARQPRLTLYLARFLAEDERIWAERWQQQDRTGYRRLDQAKKWSDQQKGRDIADYGLRRLARNDPDRAWQVFKAIDRRFSWSADERGRILGEIAMWSAVDGVAETHRRMQEVPETYRGGKLLEWWVRYDIRQQNWQNISATISQMSPGLKDDSRWRYWDARARFESGGSGEGREKLAALALEANFYGFLSADMLNMPYTICQQEPQLSAGEIDKLAQQPGFDRALELRKAGITGWSRAEWKLAARKLDKQGLRVAAGLATRENWPDMAIFALGDSGDLRWYEWRFPIEYGSLVDPNAARQNLDPSWVMGLMRSESAMAEDAVSSAGALGLMQVMPQTAKQLAKRHSFSYSGRDQLLQAEDNVQFGTAFLGELLDRYKGSEALASGAYNAGPHVVDKWVSESRNGDPVIWVETLPYYETRDYIPRVLAFATIYDWRLQRPVRRISTRMPAIDSGIAVGPLQPDDFADVVCKAPVKT
jgi:soluble lytic murein transglycosylase